MRARTAILFLLTLLIVFLVFGSPRRKRKVDYLIYHPARKPTAFLQISIPRTRPPRLQPALYFPEPPSRSALAYAIAQTGLIDFTFSGWDLSFIQQRKSETGATYSAIATKKGAREYYYLVSMEQGMNKITINVSPPILLLVCANGTLEIRKDACADGSRAEPLIAH